MADGGAFEPIDLQADTGLDEPDQADRSRNWWPLAAVAALIVGVGVASLLFRDSPIGDEAAAPADTSAPDTAAPSTSAPTTRAPQPDRPAPATSGELDVADFPVDGFLLILTNDDIWGIDFDAGTWSWLGELPSDERFSGRHPVGVVANTAIVRIDWRVFAVDRTGVRSPFDPEQWISAVSPDQTGAWAWTDSGDAVIKLDSNGTEIESFPVEHQDSQPQLFPTVSDRVFAGSATGIYELEDGVWRIRYEGQLVASGDEHIVRVTCPEVLHECPVDRIDISSGEIARLESLDSVDSASLGWAVWSQSGDLVIGQTDNTVFNIHTGTKTRLGPMPPPFSRAFSADERWLITLSSRSVQAWDVETGSAEELVLPPELRNLSIHDTPVLIHLPPETASETGASTPGQNSE